MDLERFKSFLSIKLGIFISDIDSAVREYEGNAPFLLSRKNERKFVVEALNKKYNIPVQTLELYVMEWKDINREPTYLFEDF